MSVRQLYPSFKKLSLTNRSPPVVERIDFVAIPIYAPSPTLYHHSDTYEDNCLLWLRDLLPKDVPQSRVLLYDYATSLVWRNHVQGRLPSSRLFPDLGQQFLKHLLEARKRDPHRPIIFICHSYTGLILKAALVHATQDPDYHSIADSTHGSMFFGAPHECLLPQLPSPERYQSFSLKHSHLPVASRSPLFLPNRYSRPWDVVTEPDVNDSSPGTIHKEWIRLFAGRMKSVCLDEAASLRMPEWTATLGLNPADETTLLIDLSLLDMWGVADASSSSYQNVRQGVLWLLEWLEYLHLETAKFSVSASKSVWLQNLYPGDLDCRGHLVAKPTRGTLEWLHTQSALKSWITSDSGVFWISGKPGSGKSTLMKFLSRNVRPRHCYSVADSTSRAFALETSSSFTSSAIQAGFYYNHAEPPRSATSILRFLLHQVLSCHPSLLEYVLPELQQSHDPGVDVDVPLADIILHLAKHEPLYIFLDCLDEFSASVREKITHELLNGIVHVHEKRGFGVGRLCRCRDRTSQLKVCFSTRSRDEIFWPVEHLDLSSGDAANGLIDDACLDLAYTWDVSLRSIQHRHVLMSTLEDLVFLPDTLGLFIWLKIVAKLQLSWHGATISQLALSLTEFPTVGQELLQYILDSLAQKYPAHAGKFMTAVRWLAFASRPLTVPEFQHALGFGSTVDNHRLPNWSWLGWSGEGFTALRRRISYEEKAVGIKDLLHENVSEAEFYLTCLGIFETRNDIIYLVHRTIREIFEQESFQGQSQDAHMELASACISYLMMASSREQEYGSYESFPFWSYSATRWHEHHSRGKLILDRKLTNPKSRLLHTWFPKWWQHQSETEHDLEIFPAYPTEGIVLAFLGEERLIEDLLSRKLMAADQCTMSGELWTPLMAAAWSGHTRIVDLLLSRRDNHSANPAHDARALVHAIERGHTTTAKALMMSLVNPTAGPEVLNAWVEPERTNALEAAIKGDRLDLVELLLQCGADVNAYDDRGDFALRQALDAGSLPTVKLLLCKGAAVISPTSWTSFMLHPSALKLWKLLSKAGLNTHTPDCSGYSLLHAAAAGACDAFDEELLKVTLTMDTSGLQDRCGQTPLHWAVRSGRSHFIQRLYHEDTKPFTLDPRLFLIACEAAYPDVVKFLLDRGKSPNTSSDGRYAIHHIFSVRSRIGSGAAFGSTPHETDRIAVVRLLVKKGARLDQQDHNGDTALHLAVRMLLRQSARALVELGSTVNLKNGQGYTALDLATKHGDIDLMSMLLRAEACISNVSWRHALESGNTIAIRKLRDEAISFSGSNTTEKMPPRICCTEELSPCPNDLFKYFVASGGYPPKFKPAILLLHQLGITTPHRIMIGTKTDSSFANSFKVWWESVTNRRWIWWPLAPCIQNLRVRDSWLQWTCEECGCHDRAVIRRDLAQQIVDFLLFLTSVDANIDVNYRGELASSDEGFELSALFGHATARGTEPASRLCHSPLDCLMTPSRSPNSYLSRHSPATPVRTVCSTQKAPSSQRVSDGDAVRQASHSAPDSSGLRVNDKKISSKQSGSTNSHTDGELGCQVAKASDKGRFVLCMPGSFPIQHIDVGNVRTDDELFDELCSLYRSRLPTLKWLLSINRFHHYGFDKYEKSGHVLVSRSDGSHANSYLPVEAPDDIDYDYTRLSDDPIQEAPICQQIFYGHFYFCKRRCAAPASLVHNCYRRFDDNSSVYRTADVENHLRKTLRMRLIPKRKQEWQPDADEFAWGLTAFECPSFFGFLAWTVICFGGPAAFWALWLSVMEHTGDLQNASVPFTLGLTLWSILYQSARGRKWNDEGQC